MYQEMLSYYNMIKTHDIKIAYCGPMWAEGISGLGEILKKKMEIEDIPRSIHQSVFSVFVEQMNNIQMYSTEKEELFSSKENGQTEVNGAASTGVFILGNEGKCYHLQSGNVVSNDKIALIRERIDYLNTLDKEQLRKYYKERLRAENTNADSKGAGVGLIEIARRATSKIQYNIEPYNEGNSFLVMHVEIGGEEK